jgi:hypothetical protein
VAGKGRFALFINKVPKAALPRPVRSAAMIAHAVRISALPKYQATALEPKGTVQVL